METSNKKPSNHHVHKVLAHSYTVYLVLLLVGILLDLVFRIKILEDSIMVPVGFFFLVFASFVIVWAQKTGRDLRKITKETKDIKKEHFSRGPYQYTRIPTQFGLFLLTLGFGIILNAFFVILSTIISFFIVKFLFMNKHDKALLDKYGDAYREYKKLVKF